MNASSCDLDSSIILSSNENGNIFKVIRKTKEKLESELEAKLEQANNDCEKINNTFQFHLQTISSIQKLLEEALINRSKVFEIIRRKNNVIEDIKEDINRFFENINQLKIFDILNVLNNSDSSILNYFFDNSSDIPKYLLLPKTNEIKKVEEYCYQNCLGH